MAYMNQDRKKKIEAAVKMICKKHGVKGSLRVDRSSTLVLTLRSGIINFLTDHLGQPHWTDGRHQMDVNHYWYDKHFTGKALAFFEEVIPAMNDGNHDNSDIQSDYFDVGWYVNVKVGKWDKPYVLEE